MSLHLVFPDSVANFMPFSFEFLQPAKYFKDCYDGRFSFQNDFLSNISSNLTKDDIVIWFIDCKGDENVEILANCKARKFLRVVDPSKSDKVLYKGPLALHEKVNFEGFAICYPNKDHIAYLEEKNVKVIIWPHSLDFSKSKELSRKEMMYICAGQQHQKYYPDRWKLAEILCRNFPKEGIFLPHPGFELNSVKHPYIGEKFLELLENFYIMPVGIGINDGMHMKFVEAAFSNVLPIGLTPSYMPEEISSLIPFSKLDPEDYVENKILEELVYIFSPGSNILDRIKKYKSYFIENYDLKKVLGSVSKEIFK